MKKINDYLPIENPGERHVAVILALDTSSSMEGKPIEELNQGLQAFADALKEDELASGRADVMILTFDSKVQEYQGFTPATSFTPPQLNAYGYTRMNEALIYALDADLNQKAIYKSSGTSYYRTWLFVLTDGLATDTSKESEARARVQDAIRNKKISYFPMGIGPQADMNKLKSYYPDEWKSKIYLKANKNNFKEAFVWLSNSIVEVVNSNPEVTPNIQLPAPDQSITIGLD